MRAAPPFQVSLRRFDAWRGAVWSLAALGVATMLAWALTHERPLAPALVGIAMGAPPAIFLLGRRLARRRPVDVRWDGTDWHVSYPPAEPVSGRLGVAIDLGPWMLLHFVAQTAPGRARSIWLPVQRRGLERDWHGLRCAVYSPRPAAAAGAEPAHAVSFVREP